jgi:iron complex outermembrane receptor protein
MPQEIEIGGRSTIDLQMQLDVETLTEVVVVGYGTQDKKEITSSVTSVKAEDFNGGNVNDPSQLIQGKVAGLVIARPGANPSQGFNIRLRGLSSFGANTSPLVVIDGIIGADLNNVDPNDIASIDVLKDGSAAAIYGTRGSSGVILITTKSGKKGKSTIDYNGNVTVESVAKDVPVADAGQYREFSRQLGFGNDFGSSTDWFDELTRDAVAQIHNLSLSGGSESTTYRASFNYRQGDGVAINSGYEQFNGRLNLTQRAINDKLTFNLNIAATERIDDKIFDQAFRYATIYNPTAPVRSDDPAYDIYDGFFEEVLFDYYNPVAIVNQTDWEEKKKVLNVALRADYDITDELRVGAFYSRQRENRIFAQYADKNSFWGGRDRNGLASRGSEENFNHLFETTVNYQKTFGDLDMALLGGYSYQDFVDEGFGMQGGDFLTDAFQFNNMGASLDFANGLGGVLSFKNNHRLVAFFGRVNLNYQNTYFLSASVRREGSTRFGENNKWGNFPAVSAGVNISNLVDIPYMNELKFRASYGVTGNLPGSSYISLQRFGPQGTFFYNGSFVPSFGPNSNPNPNLQWEKKGELDFGLDFAMFDNRLTGTIDYYRRTTTDLIYPTRVPVPPNFVGTTDLNIGELQNNGFEFAANYLAIDKGDFSWSIGGNISTFTTELSSLSTEEFDFGGFFLTANLGSPGQNNTELIRVEEGKPIGQIWGKIYEGIDEGGNWIFQDLNGDGVINDSDETVLGNGLPDFTFGINSTINYKNWDFNFFLRGAMGHDMVNTFRAFYEAPQALVSYNVLESTSDVINLTDNPLFSSLHVEDASFLTLDNFTVGYTFDVPQGSWLKKARLYIAGQRPFVITGYSGVDPEVRFADGTTGAGQSVFPDNTDGNPFAPGIDRRNTWFRSRSFTFGANISF